MADLLSRTRQIEGLETGKGLQYLLDEAYRMIGNPILIHDMEYKAFGFSGGVQTDDPLWIEYYEHGTVGYEWLDFFKHECFLEAAANAKTITFLTSKKLKYNRIYGKVFNRNSIQVGCAVMTACDKPFDRDDPVLFEAFCAVLTAEIGSIEFYNDYGQAYFEKLMGELIAGVTDVALYAAHVESIYMHLKSNLYLAVVDTGEANPDHARLAALRDACKAVQPEYMYAVHGNYVVIILGTDDRALYVETDLSRLSRLFRERNIYAGISRTFENLFDLPKHYRQALDALEHGQRAEERHIFLHEQLLP